MNAIKRTNKNIVQVEMLFQSILKNVHYVGLQKRIVLYLTLQKAIMHTVMKMK